MGIPTVSQFGSSIPLPSTATQGNSPAVAVDAVAQAPKQQAPQESSANSASLEQALKEIEVAVQAKANNLQFSIDDTTGKTIVVVTDSTTGDKIRQLPSEEALAIARNIERMKGFLLKDSA